MLLTKINTVSSNHNVAVMYYCRWLLFKKKKHNETFKIKSWIKVWLTNCRTVLTTSLWVYCPTSIKLTRTANRMFVLSKPSSLANSAMVICGGGFFKWPGDFGDRLDSGVALSPDPAAFGAVGSPGDEGFLGPLSIPPLVKKYDTISLRKYESGSTNSNISFKILKQW